MILRTLLFSIWFGLAALAPAFAQTAADADTTRTTAEVMPSFKTDLAKYWTDNLVYPPLAAEKGVEGDVLVRAIVAEDGSIRKAEVAKGIGSGCDQEALRLVRFMPRWNPGRDKGQPVAVRVEIAVPFRIKPGTANAPAEVIQPAEAATPGKPSLTYAEVMPRAPYDVSQYLTSQLKYPIQALIDSIEGTVYVQFLVTELGLIDSARIIRGVRPDMDNSALALVRNMPAWQPGRQGGVAVPVRITVPVRFKMPRIVYKEPESPAPAVKATAPVKKPVSKKAPAKKPVAKPKAAARNKAGL